MNSTWALLIDKPQVVAGDGLQVVGFVEDDHVVLGQDAGLLPPQGQVGEEQGMVDDEDLGMVSPPPGLVVEAILIARAGPAHAVAVVAGHLVPDGRMGAKIEVRQRAVAAFLRPGGQLPKLGEVLIFAEEARSAGQGPVQPPQADVVAPPFHQHRGKLHRHHAPQQGQVFLHQLLLQADRVSGDDDPPARLVLGRGGGSEDGRHQVREALAHAGAGLDDEVSGFLDGRRHGSGHGKLLAAVFVVLQPGGDAASRPQDVGGRVHKV